MIQIPLQSERIFLCIRVADMIPHIPGVVERKCETCQTPVWVSPSTLKIYDPNEDWLLCPKCTERFEHQVTVEPLTPDQTAEMMTSPSSRDREIPALLNHADAEERKRMLALMLKKANESGS